MRSHYAIGALALALASPAWGTVDVSGSSGTAIGFTAAAAPSALGAPAPVSNHSLILEEAASLGNPASLSTFFDGSRKAVSRALFSQAKPSSAYVPARQVEFWAGSPQIEKGLLDMAARAQSRLDVEFMDFRGDAHGMKMAQALLDAAHRGVQVRVLVDNLYGRYVNPLHDWQDGMMARGQGTAAMYDAMRKAGIDVRYSNAGRKGFFPLERDHRKVFVMDGAEGVATGFMPNDANYSWHDAAAHVVGSGATMRLAHHFDQRWMAAGGAKAMDAFPKETVPSPAPKARVVATDPDLNSQWRIRKSVLGHIEKARKSIYIENSYFTDGKVFRALEDAATRGVDVRFVYNEHVDWKISGDAEAWHLKKLLRSGVKVYAYPRMFHTKAMSVDGTWASVGSGNLMPLLEVSQNELDIEVKDEASVAQLDRDLFQKDFQDSTPLTLDNLKEHVPSKASQVLAQGLSVAYYGYERGVTSLKHAVQGAIHGIQDRLP